MAFHDGASSDEESGIQHFRHCVETYAYLKFQQEPGKMRMAVLNPIDFLLPLPGE